MGRSPKGEKTLPEPFSAEHLQQLRQRWERDPKSRAFLQLAEEYRRAGQLGDAVHVLRAGLQEHPTYLSAQVALGRCLMESGAPDGAAEILERAVARDPTQLVANKLLVEAYLAKGLPDKASERLNLYKLFNDRDAEIEPLEARIRALQGLPPAAAARKGATREPQATALFELPALGRLPEVDLEPILAARRSGAASRPSEPFGVLHASSAIQLIDTAFAQQGIFVLAPPAPAPMAAAPATVAWDGDAWPQESTPTETAGAAVASAVSEARADLPERSPVIEDAVEPVPPPEWEAELPGLPISEAPKAASSTLGELYLAQGHLDEAEESFQSVLQARPGDGAALAGLESVRQHRGDAAAAFSEELPVAEESNVIVGGLTTRKVALLRDFLTRIRRGAGRHVS